VRHEEATLLLAEHAGGGLDATTRAEVDRHLGDCADCREWLDAFALAAVAARETARPREHPDADTLARFAFVPAALADEDWAEIERHSSGCTSCARELAAVREAAAAADAPSDSAGERAAVGRRLVPALAASLAAALLGAGWLALANRDLGRRLDATARGGAVDVTWVGPVERSARSVEIATGTAADLAHVALALPAEAVGDAATVHWRLLADDAGERWAVAMPGAAVRSQLAETGFVLLALPRRALSPGPVRLVVESEPRDGSRRAVLAIDVGP
jgi:hypothetical protein